MFGEGYQPGYDRPAGTGASIDGGGPDWWLIEVSALPFVRMVFEADLFAWACDLREHSRSTAFCMLTVQFAASTCRG